MGLAHEGKKERAGLRGRNRGIKRVRPQVLRYGQSRRRCVHYTNDQVTRGTLA